MTVCEFFGAPKEDINKPCPQCGQGDVRVLSRQERRSFSGETIEIGNDGAAREERRSSYQQSRPSGVYVKQIRLFGGGWWWKALLAVVALGAVFIFLLPVFFVLVIASLLGWFFLRLR